MSLKHVRLLLFRSWQCQSTFSVPYCHYVSAVPHQVRSLLHLHRDTSYYVLLQKAQTPLEHWIHHHSNLGACYETSENK
jgi:hypothetical protein